jgi:hypothetical protein
VQKSESILYVALFFPKKIAIFADRFEADPENGRLSLSGLIQFGKWNSQVSG